MPIATPEVYAEMLGRAKGALRSRFRPSTASAPRASTPPSRASPTPGSDGIIQFSTGGAEFGSGLGVKDMVTGRGGAGRVRACDRREVSITVALHTDHCPKDKLDGYVRPLLAISAARRQRGNPLFQSHMWDGSAVPIDENLSIAQGC